MPLLSFRLTSSLSGIQADQSLACDIKKWIKGESPFIAESRVVGSLQPGLHVAFSYPRPMDSCCPIARLGQNLTELCRYDPRNRSENCVGIRNGNQAQIGLTPDDQRFDGMRIQLDGLGRKLNFFPEVRSLKRGFELLFRPQHGSGFPFGSIVSILTPVGSCWDSRS